MRNILPSQAEIAATQSRVRQLNEPLIMEAANLRALYSVPQIIINPDGGADCEDVWTNTFAQSMFQELQNLARLNVECAVEDLRSPLNFIPARPADQRGGAIWEDVYGRGESDLDYFLRRGRELGA